MAPPARPAAPDGTRLLVPLEEISCPSGMLVSAAVSTTRWHPVIEVASRRTGSGGAVKSFLQKLQKGNRLMKKGSKG